jgi:Holliday junction resolvase
MPIRRTDANQKEIVQTFRDLGGSVFVLSMVGKGCPDVVLGLKGNNYLIEIKDGSKPPSKQVLTPDELKFHQSWKGQVCVINSIDQAIDFVKKC